MPGKRKKARAEGYKARKEIPLNVPGYELPQNPYCMEKEKREHADWTLGYADAVVEKLEGEQSKDTEKKDSEV